MEYFRKKVRFPTETLVTGMVNVKTEREGIWISVWAKINSTFLEFPDFQNFDTKFKLKQLSVNSFPQNVQFCFRSQNRDGNSYL